MLYDFMPEHFRPTVTGAVRVAREPGQEATCRSQALAMRRVARAAALASLG